MNRQELARFGSIPEGYIMVGWSAAIAAALMLITLVCSIHFDYIGNHEWKLREDLPFEGFPFLFLVLTVAINLAIDKWILPWYDPRRMRRWLIQQDWTDFETEVKKKMLRPPIVMIGGIATPLPTGKITRVQAKQHAGQVRVSFWIDGQLANMDGLEFVHWLAENEDPPIPPPPKWQKGELD